MAGGTHLMGILSLATRSSPSRSNTGCAFCLTTNTRSWAGRPGSSSPFPAGGQQAASRSQDWSSSWKRRAEKVWSEAAGGHTRKEAADSLAATLMPRHPSHPRLPPNIHPPAARHPPPGPASQPPTCEGDARALLPPCLNRDLQSLLHGHPLATGGIQDVASHPPPLGGACVQLLKRQHQRHLRAGRPSRQAGRHAHTWLRSLN